MCHARHGRVGNKLRRWCGGSPCLYSAVKGRSEDLRVGDTLIYIAPKCSAGQKDKTEQREMIRDRSSSLGVEDGEGEGEQTAKYVLPDELDLTTGSQHF